MTTYKLPLTKVSNDILLALNRESDIHKQLSACCQGEIKPSELDKNCTRKASTDSSDHAMLHRSLVRLGKGLASRGEHCEGI